MLQPLDVVAERVAKLLVRQSLKIVFAESCTGGLVSATLARIPGISQSLCGSAVAYRLDTKVRWLGVPESILDEFGAISAPVARAMAEGALRITEEADLSASITGHLGPDAPDDQDGLIFVGIAIRGGGNRIESRRISGPIPTTETDSGRFSGKNERELRQWAAVDFVLNQVEKTIISLASNY